LDLLSFTAFDFLGYTFRRRPAKNAAGELFLSFIDPYAYLVDVLQRVHTHPQRRVDELTPRLWKERFARQPMPSLMEILLQRRQELSPH